MDNPDTAIFVSVVGSEALAIAVFAGELGYERRWVLPDGDPNQALALAMNWALENRAPGQSIGFFWDCDLEPNRRVKHQLWRLEAAGYEVAVIPHESQFNIARRILRGDNVSPTGKRRYVTATSEEQLAEILDKAIQSGLFALDTEATNMKGVHLDDFDIVGLSMCFGDNVGYYVPITHSGFAGLEYQTEENVPRERAARLVRDLLAVARPIYHNASFDRAVIAKHLGLPIESTWGYDTVIAAHLVNENQSLGLKDLSAKYLGVQETPWKPTAGELKLGLTPLVATRSATPVAFKDPETGKSKRQFVWQLLPGWQERVADYYHQHAQGAVSFGTTMAVTHAMLGVLRTAKIIEHKGPFPKVFSLCPVNFGTVYAADDAINTFELFRLFIDQHLGLNPQLLRLYTHTETKVDDVMTRASYKGMVTDVAHLIEMRELLNERLKPVEAELEEHLGAVLPIHWQGKYKNGNSTHLALLLYHDLGLPVIYRSKRSKVTELVLSRLAKRFPEIGEPNGWEVGQGAPSAARASLEGLLKAKPEDGDPHVYGLLEAHLRYQAITKLRNTYTDSIIKAVDPRGFLHPNYNTAGTVSGRFSSQEPNFQNMPRLLPEEVAKKPWLQGIDIRKGFVAPKGYVLVSADYSAMELVMCAALSNCKSMRDLLNQGRDLHVYTAKYAFKVGQECAESKEGDEEFKKKYKDYRQKAKTVNFAMIYGGSEVTLVRNFGFSEEEAKQLVAGYFEAYPEVRVWIEAVNRELLDNGYVIYPDFGYIKHLDAPPSWLKKQDFRAYNRQLAAAQRTCQNATIQGYSAFIVKDAIVHIDEVLRERGIDAWVCAQIHDEIGCYVKEEYAHQVGEIMVSCMRREVKGVMLDAEVEFKYTMSKAEKSHEVEDSAALFEPEEEEDEEDMEEAA